jgi:restriction system protein
MKLRMAENSLFAILLRSPWWISLVLAAIVALVARLALPADLFWFGAFGGLPFVVIAVMAARRQWRAPSAAQLARTAAQAQTLAWRDFAAALEAGWRRQGFDVTRREGGADFVLRKGDTNTLVSARRWKAASLGLEPLRELQAALDAAELRHGAIVALGDITPQAARYAADHGIRVLGVAELAGLLG